MAQALFDAVRKDDADTVTRLLDAEPALVSARDPNGQTPILTAVYHRRRAVLDVLRARTTSIDLFEASAIGDLAAVRTSLAREPGAIGTRSGDGWTALHLAAHFGHASVVELLLEHGADVHARSSNAMHNQPLHAAAAGGSATAVVARLLARGADVDAELARLLLATGADHRRATAEGETAAAIAARSGHTALAQLLAGSSA